MLLFFLAVGKSPSLWITVVILCTSEAVLPGALIQLQYGPGRAFACLLSLVAPPTPQEYGMGAPSLLYIAVAVALVHIDQSVGSESLDNFEVGSLRTDFCNRNVTAAHLIFNFNTFRRTWANPDWSTLHPVFCAMGSLIVKAARSGTLVA